ncbi:MAG: cobalamin biosynthesis protein, partial [Pseudaminobacter sp.]|nr:cobalamin biosynthesis protein [Pseudaminobacter sp.]
QWGRGVEAEPRRRGGKPLCPPHSENNRAEPIPAELSAETLSYSDLSLALAGTPSVSETAALAAAGQGARLLGPRLVLGSVTCALATNGDAA